MAAPKTPQAKTVTRSLPCELTDEELRERADQLVVHIRELEALDEEKKEASKKFRDKMRAIGSKVSVFSKQIEDKKEVREVECLEAPDYNRKLMVITRKDTGEVLGTRPLSSEDLQAPLPNLTPIDGGKKGGKAKAAPAGKKGVKAVAAEDDDEEDDDEEDDEDEEGASPNA